MCRGRAPPDDRQLRLRFLQRDARRQPSKDMKHRSLQSPKLPGIGTKRNPVLVIERKHEARGHDADNGRGRATEIDHAADDVRVAAEPRLPHLVADDDDGRRPGAFVVRNEVASELRRRARHGKSRGADLRNPDGLIRRRADDEIVLRGAGGAELLDRPQRLAPIREVGQDLALGGTAGLCGVLESDDATAVLERQDGIGDFGEEFEARRADGNRHGHGESAGQRQAAVLDEHAYAEPRVERHRVDPLQPARRAPFLFVLLDAAEHDQRLAPRLDGIEPPLADEALGLHLDMEAHFIVHRGVELMAAPQSPPHRAHPRP